MPLKKFKINKEPRKLEIASGNAEILLKNGKVDLEIPPNSIKFKKGMLLKIVPQAVRLSKTRAEAINYSHHLARLESREMIAKVLDFKERDDGSNQVSIELQNFESS